MTRRIASLAALCMAVIAAPAHAEADKSQLGGLFGYARGTPETAMQDGFIVDAASHPEAVFESRKVKRSGPAWELPAGTPLDPSKVRYAFNGAQRTLEDYLASTRTTAMLVLKDGRIVFERYQYDRKPEDRFLSFSMAKTITAMLVGLALQDGAILGLDDTARTYVPALKDSAFGDATLRQLLSMTSGVRWNDGVMGVASSDMLQLNECHMRHRGCDSSVGLLASRRERAAAAGTRFNYSGGDAMVLGHVLRAASGVSVSEYTQRTLWSRLGAEDDAAWMVDRDGVENVFGHFAARLRDYGRLGLLMARKGATHDGTQLLPATYWTEMTSPAFEATRPRVATPYFGYGYQLWLDPKPGVFCFRGLKGQAIYVDVPKQLVVVRLAVARSDDTADSSERDYMWHGLRALF